MALLVAHSFQLVDSEPESILVVLVRISSAAVATIFELLEKEENNK